MRPPCEEQKRRMRSVARAAAEICPRYGIDPEKCLLDAIMLSTGGKFAIYYNYWNLQGEGDLGYVKVVKIRRVADAGEGGGVKSEVRKVARFSSDEAGVTGYCQAIKRSGQ